MVSLTKQLASIQKARPLHWVGDGFPVRSAISPQDPPQDNSPFLLLDYAEPFQFAPADTPRGVGEQLRNGVPASAPSIRAQRPSPRRRS